MSTRHDFVAAAMSMQGIPFAHQGRSPKFGVDCAGLAICAARMCGLDPLDFKEYKRNPEASDFMRTILDSVAPIKRLDSQAGDLWVLKYSGNPQHVCIQIEDRVEGKPVRIIHATSVSRRVVVHDLDPNVTVQGVYRVKEFI